MNDMPDLPTRYRNRVSAFISRQGGLKPCAVCGTDNWTPNYPVTLPPTDANVDGEEIKNQTTTSLVPVSCYKCGQTVFFDAVKIGVCSRGTRGVSYFSPAQTN